MKHRLSKISKLLLVVLSLILSVSLSSCDLADLLIGECTSHVDSDKNKLCDRCFAPVEPAPCPHTDQDGNPLTVDGVIGQKTWWALDETETTLYTVTVPHLTKSQADALTKQYPGSSETEERG